MKYQGDIGLYLSGAPVPLPECALFITQPTVRQIVQFGESNFLTAVHLLSKTNEYLDPIREGNPELAKKTDFQLLMIMIHEDKSIRSYLDSFFELTFPEYNVNYEQNAIVFSLREDDKRKGMITMYSFDKFVSVVKELFTTETSEKEDYNPANEAAAKIAEKLKKAREQTDPKSSSDENISLFGTYASILSVGLKMDINIFYNYTPFQIVDNFKRYWEKDKSDFYRKVSITPLMDTSKMEVPEEWTRNLY